MGDGRRNAGGVRDGAGIARDYAGALCYRRLLTPDSGPAQISEACATEPRNFQGDPPVTRLFIAAGASLTTLAVLGLAGCKSMTEEKKPVVAVAEMMPTTAAIAANLKPSGTVTLTQVGTNRVLIKAEISGLKPYSEHGFHVHAVPDCSGDGLKTGGHFNPDGHPHGDPSHILRHAGAMFNIKTDGAGVGTTRQEVDTITLGPSTDKYSVIGKPLITHRDPDDYVSQPLGNAGPRVSCGIIKLVPAP